MENLISRWKSSLNSAKKSQSVSGNRQLRDSQNNGSDKKGSANLNSSSSSEGEFYDRKKFIASLKKLSLLIYLIKLILILYRDISLSNSRSSASLNKGLDKALSPRNNKQQHQQFVESEYNFERTFS